MFKIKFDLKKDPTNLKQISHWPLGFGILLAFLTFFLFYAGRHMPMELFILYLVELVGEFIMHLLALSTIFITTGLLLRELSWRKGYVTIDEDRLLITGDRDFYLKYDRISEMRHLRKKTLQIRTRYFPVRIRFEELEEMNKTRSLLEKKSPAIIQSRQTHKLN
jgi:hypothetical protein